LITKSKLAGGVPNEMLAGAAHGRSGAGWMERTAILQCRQTLATIGPVRPFSGASGAGGRVETDVGSPVHASDATPEIAGISGEIRYWRDRSSGYRCIPDAPGRLGESKWRNPGSLIERRLRVPNSAEQQWPQSLEIRQVEPHSSRPCLAEHQPPYPTLRLKSSDGRVTPRFES